MTALSFFSYKGGVGRTMALTNLAMRLVEFGKSVFIIDFDLEAPGVPFKLNNRQINPDQIESGVVDYIHEFTANGKIDSLERYVKELPKNNLGDEKMWLMPAGNANLDEYWNKLSRINWHSLFYTEGGKGLRFFLDLKERIRKQYNPDFILIDSRTGITELSGISLKILADEVVVLFINNEENIHGTQKVISFLYKKKDAKEQLQKLHLILTRIEHHKNQSIGFNREYKLLTQIEDRFSKALGTKVPGIYVIHTDDRLQMNERLALLDKNQRNNDTSSINSEYTGLFETLFKDKFTKEEWEKNQNINKAATLYNKAMLTTDISERISILTDAIKLDDEKWLYYYNRGQALEFLFKFDEAASDYKQSYFLSGQTMAQISYAWCLSESGKNTEALEAANMALEKLEYPDGLNIKAIILLRLNRIDDALQFLNQKITVYSKSDILYNSRADLLRRLKRFDEALNDIFKAIEVSSSRPSDLLPPYYYGTLADIYGDMGKIEEFYFNLAEALSRGLSVYGIRIAKDVYEKFRHEKRFIELLKSYNIDSEDIFHNGPPKNLNTNISSDDFDEDDDDIVPQSVS